MRRVLPLLAVLLTGLAPAPPYRPKPGETDLKALQGEWLVVRTISEGVETQVTARLVWQIKGDRVAHVFQGTAGPPVIRLILGRSNAPRTMDMTAEGATPALSVYQLEGDTLRVATGEPRPKDLSGRGADSVVWVLKRKKP